MRRRRVLLLVAYSLLGLAVLVGNGTLPGLPFALASAVLLFRALKHRAPILPSALPWLVALSAVLVLTRAPAAGSLRLFLVPLTILQAAVSIAASLRPRLAGRATLSVGVGLYAVAGALLITRAPPPRVDVFDLQQGGARVLESGGNPYAAVYPNVYTKEETRIFYGDERSELRDYPYLPLSLLATTLGHRIGGDVRWTLLAVQLAIALLLFQLCREAGHTASVALAVATLHLLHPRALFVLEQSWTDALLAGAFLVVVLVLQKHRARWFGLALGVYFAFKQYSVMTLPVFLSQRELRPRAWAVALGVTSAVTLPFFLWSPAGFFSGVVLCHVGGPFRADSLSIPAFVAWATGWRAPGLLAPAAAVAAFAFARLRFRTSSPPNALPLCAAVVFESLFLFGKQAFCNYYYFVGVLILAAAASLAPADVAAHAARLE